MEGGKGGRNEGDGLMKWPTAHLHAGKTLDMSSTTKLNGFALPDHETAKKKSPDLPSLTPELPSCNQNGQARERERLQGSSIHVATTCGTYLNWKMRT